MLPMLLTLFLAGLFQGFEHASATRRSLVVSEEDAPSIAIAQTDGDEEALQASAQADPTAMPRSEERELAAQPQGASIAQTKTASSAAGSDSSLMRLTEEVAAFGQLHLSVLGDSLQRRIQTEQLSAEGIRLTILQVSAKSGWMGSFLVFVSVGVGVAVAASCYARATTDNQAEAQPGTAPSQSSTLSVQPGLGVSVSQTIANMTPCEGTDVSYALTSPSADIRANKKTDRFFG